MYFFASCQPPFSEIHWIWGTLQGTNIPHLGKSSSKVIPDSKKTNKIQETQGKELLENQPKKIALDRARVQWF